MEAIVSPLPDDVEALKALLATATQRADEAEAQLANAQTCSAGALMALAQVNAGPDIESGATEAAETLAGIMPACRSGLR